MLISVMSVGQKALSVANCRMFCSVNCYVVLLMDDGRNLCKLSDCCSQEMLNNYSAHDLIFISLMKVGSFLPKFTKNLLHF